MLMSVKQAFCGKGGYTVQFPYKYCEGGQVTKKKMRQIFAEKS